MIGQNAKEIRNNSLEVVNQKKNQFQFGDVNCTTYIIAKIVCYHQ